MKKTLLVIALILTGCVAQTPSETIRNPQCFNSYAFKIVQLNDDVSLIQTVYCEPSIDDTKTARECNAGMYLQDGVEAMNLRKQVSASRWKELSKTIYDGKIYTLGDNCLVQDGNYTYNNVIGSKKTIRQLKMVESQIPNPKYEKWKAEQDAKKIETNTENK